MATSSSSVVTPIDRARANAGSVFSGASPGAPRWPCRSNAWADVLNAAIMTTIQKIRMTAIQCRRFEVPTAPAAIRAGPSNRQAGVNHKLASAPLLPKLVSEGAAVHHELPKRSTRGAFGVGLLDWLLPTR